MRFLEIGGDPDVFGLADNQQLLAGFDTLADLNGIAGDDACGGRVDFGVGEVECGLVDLRASGKNGGFAGSVVAWRINVANITAEAISQRLTRGFQSWPAELLCDGLGIFVREISHQDSREWRRVMYGGGP